MTTTVGILSTMACPRTSSLMNTEIKTIKEKFAMAKKHGIEMFLFFPEDVNWKNTTIKGYVFISIAGKKGFWRRRTFAFPDIIYNRIHRRTHELQPRVKKLLTRFRNNPNVILLNERFFDKWEVYNALLNDPTTVDVVPPTRLLSYANLRDYLDQGSVVFLKPRRNNAARGIFKVIRTPNIYRFSQATGAPPSWEKHIRFRDLWRQLRISIKNRHSYTVQKGINLCRVDGRVLDFRIQVQKDGNGDWVYTGGEARLAVSGRFVTTGIVYGTRLSVKKALDKISKGSDDFKNSINWQLKHILIHVPIVLERKLGLPLAVLSIDIGIDTHGKVWIIEVSSRPEAFVARRIRNRHYKFLMEYFLHIYEN